MNPTIAQITTTLWCEFYLRRPQARTKMTAPKYPHIIGNINYSTALSRRMVAITAIRMLTPSMMKKVVISSLSVGNKL